MHKMGGARPPFRTASQSGRQSGIDLGRGETILLVEDNERIREAGQETLESLGYRALIASNGREALEVYRSAEKVDLVLTDIVMPEMGGKELVRELRKMNPALKVVITTGYVLTADLEELEEAGIQEVIRKPLDVNSLAETLRRVLDVD